MIFRAWVLGTATALVTACTLIPDYERPAAPVPESWPDQQPYSDAIANADGSAAIDSLGWREVFAGDQALVDLIERALTANRDLRIAALDVLRARAQYRIEEAGRFPRIGVAADYVRSERPSSSFGTLGRGSRIETETTELSVGVASYELDVFGRIRSLEEGALQRYLATEQARRSVQISLIAEVASAYLTYQADRARQWLARETLDNRLATMALAQRRFDLAVSSRLDLNQARLAVEQARAEVHRQDRRVAQDRNALRLLTGDDLPESLRAAREFADVTLALPLPADLRASLLLRRPDVRQAERELLAANADIGAARAAFFPSITLTGSYGTLSADLDGLFTAGSESWSFTPRLVIPLFDGGRREAELAVATLRKRQEIARYEATIQQAFREVADALAARGTLGREMVAQQGVVEAARETYELSVKRFDHGVDSFLAVLDAQRELFGARSGLIDVRSAILGNAVELYRSLGGGWLDHTADAAPEGGVDAASLESRE